MSRSDKLPRANIMVNKFHMIRRVNEALDKVRTRLQNKKNGGGKGPLFHNRYLLLRKAESLSDDSVRRSGLKEFGALFSMLRNWRNEILNYNGFVEGRLLTKSLQNLKPFPP